MTNLPFYTYTLQNVHGCFLVTDGSLYMATPVDPVFILLPVFDQARMKVTRSMLLGSSQFHCYFPV